MASAGLIASETLVCAGVLIVETHHCKRVAVFSIESIKFALPFSDQLLVFTICDFVSDHAPCPLSSTALRCNQRLLHGYHRDSSFSLDCSVISVPSIRPTAITRCTNNDTAAITAFRSAAASQGRRAVDENSLDAASEKALRSTAPCMLPPHSVPWNSFCNSIESHPVDYEMFHPASLLLLYINPRSLPSRRSACCPLVPSLSKRRARHSSW